MQRRDFLRLAGTAAVMPSSFAQRAAARRATVLYDDGATSVSDEGQSSDPAELWIRKSDLKRINKFEVKPQGACRDDLCIPIPSDMSRGGNFNLTAFAKKVGQTVVADADENVWSFGEIPLLRGGFLSSRVAPDFAVPDRRGRTVHLSDFKGKKVLLVTWASWWGCRLDLPGWQNIYLELKARNFEIVAAAQDTGGEAAAGKWYDAAKATFTTLVDRQHAVSSVFQFINVPMGVWIDERGRVVRPAEPAWTTSRTDVFGGKPLVIEGAQYVAALRDWVVNGDRSPYVLSDAEFARRVKPRSPQEMEAEASFKMAVWFQQTGKPALAARYFERAQQLNPTDWNYHRQEWSFTPEEAGRKWLEKFQKLDTPYYPKIEIKPEGSEPK
jgi:peroxiredoxin